MSLGITKRQADEVRREGALADHVRSALPGPFNPASLAKSYSLPIPRVSAIIKRNGGSIG